MLKHILKTINVNLDGYGRNEINYSYTTNDNLEVIYTELKKKGYNVTLSEKQLDIDNVINSNQLDALVRMKAGTTPRGDTMTFFEKDKIIELINEYF